MITPQPSIGYSRSQRSLLVIRWFGHRTRAPLAPTLLDQFPGVTGTVRLARWGGIVRYGNNIFREDSIVQTEPAFSEIFSFPLLIALVLSGLHPVIMFRNQHLKFGGTGLFGRGLIILQFGLSILLVISTLVMFQQLSYIRTKDLGFDQDQVVVIWTHGINPIDQFRNTLTPYDNIHQVSGSATSFGPDRGAVMVGYG